VTFDEHPEGNPVWSPDGRELAFSSGRRSAPGTYRLTVGMPGQETLFVRDVYPTDWSRDGRWILGTRQTKPDSDDIVLVNAQDPQDIVSLTNSPFDERQGQLSPDGQWVAYISNENGRYEVYVQHRTRGERRKLSAGGAHNPRWSPDGRYVYYLHSLGHVNRVAIDSGHTENVLQTRNHPITATFFRFALSSDGQRLLVSQPLDDRVRTVVVLNWRARLS
jgi:Tol biopolymer transport system component